MKLRKRRRGVKLRKPIRQKPCMFCTKKLEIDYKNTILLHRFLSERGKILGGRITGNCAGHQRQLTQAIKRARILALLPFKTFYEF